MFVGENVFRIVQCLHFLQTLRTFSIFEHVLFSAALRPQVRMISLVCIMKYYSTEICLSSVLYLFILYIGLTILTCGLGVAEKKNVPTNNAFYGLH